MSIRFFITAKNVNGKTIKKIYTQKSFREVEAILKRENLKLLSVRRLTKNDNIFKRFIISKSVTDEDLLYFTRNIATLVNSGTNILSAITQFNQNNENYYFKSILSEIIEEIKSGTDLDQAFAKFPGVFNQMYISLLRTGLESGRLGDVLEKISTYLERNVEINMIFNSALVYPRFVVIFLFIIFLVMLKFVFPAFQDIYQSTGGDFPFLTNFLINFAKFVQVNFLFIIAGIVILIIGVKFLKKISFINKAKDKLILKIPLIGKVIKNLIITRVFFTLAILQNSGVYITKALTITKDTPQNYQYKQALINILEEIKNGNTIATSFRKSKMFPDSVSELINTSEETGSTSETFERISNYYEAETNLKIKGFSKVFEPVMIVVIGIIIALVLVSIYLPIMNLGSNFQSY